MEQQYYMTHVEVDMDALRNNYHQVRNFVKGKILCVVKSNAYGHGLVEVGKLFESLGADFLGVANIGEAMELRTHGVKTPILIFGYTPIKYVETLVKNNISQTIYSKEYALQVHEVLKKKNLKLKIHLKIDTGMGRIGFVCKENDDASLKDAIEVSRLPLFIHEGIFTHFASADEETDNGYTERQYNNFLKAINYLEANGVKYDIRHAANSPAIFNYPFTHLDMVRAGCILYGLQPVTGMVVSNIKPTIALVAEITHITTINDGECVGYGCHFKASSPRKVAVVSIGYGDGFWRSNGRQNYKVTINGKKALILGNVCMNQLMCDITDIDCKIGDKVTLFGFDELSRIQEITELNDTVNEEVMLAIQENVPRIYLHK